jgi:hypothetical protein
MTRCYICDRQNFSWGNTGSSGNQGKRWSLWFWSLGENMEELGAWQVQVLFVDCCTKSVLDSWSPGQKRSSPPGGLPFLWPGWRNCWSFAGRVCFLPTGLVQCFAAIQSSNFSPIDQSFLLWLVGSCKFKSGQPGPKIPSSSWQLDLFGNTVIDASLTVLGLMFLVWFQSVKRICTSGP